MTYKSKNFNRVDFDPFKKIMFDLSSRGNARNDENHISQVVKMVKTGKTISRTTSKWST